MNAELDVRAVANGFLVKAFANDVFKAEAVMVATTPADLAAVVEAWAVKVLAAGAGAAEDGGVRTAFAGGESGGGA